MTSETHPLVKNICARSSDTATLPPPCATLENSIIAVLLASIPSILLWVDADTQIRLWSKAAQEVLNFTPEQVASRPFRECQLPWDQADVEECMADSRKQKQLVRCKDIRFTDRDGNEGILGLTITPILGTTDIPEGYLILGADITRRRNLETMLAHAHKMESIGQLSAGIAHEINTPIQYVSGNLCFLQDAFAELQPVLHLLTRLQQDEPQSDTAPSFLLELREALQEVEPDYLATEIPTALSQSLEGTNQVTRIVRSMKEFSHPGNEQKTALNLNHAIESTLTVARHEWKYVAELSLDFDPQLPPVPCYPGDLNQAILNIVVNAAHAIGDVQQGQSGAKGTITIKTRALEDAVEVRIRDTGRGIPEDIRNRIFDPFFTTKEVGRGTGQGLAITYAVIVEKHQGRIYFETEAGKGTEFVLLLPLSAPASEPAPCGN
jgi:PAS domain S-box-containing protein